MTEIELRDARPPRPAPIWSRLWSRARSLDGAVLAFLATLAAVALLAPGDLPRVTSTALASFLHTLPFLAVAVGLFAYLRASGAETLIARAFQGHESRMILLAALIGGLSPFCSCEVIPFVAGLLALGTPVSAVMAFWLASPLMDPPTFLITAGALGTEFAIGKAVAAVAIGLMGGFAMMALGRAGLFAEPLKASSPVKRCGCGPAPLSGRPVWRVWAEPARRRTFGREAFSNALFLGKWLALAYLLEGVMIAFLPAQSVAAWVGGDGFGPIVMGALVGLPAYLNGYAAPPLLAGLMAQGMSPGAAMAFLVAGAVSSVPAMAAVWSLVRPPIFAAYAALGLVGAILAGAIFSLAV